MEIEVNSMKKILSTLFILTLLLSLVACQDEKLDAKEIYQKANAEMLKLDSYAVKAVANIDLSTGEEDSSSLSFPIDMEMVFTDLSSDPDFYLGMNIDAFGLNTSSKIYEVDGVVYTDVDGQKSYQEGADFKAEDYMMTDDLFLEDIDLSATKDGENYHLELELDNDTLMEAMNGLYGDQGLEAFDIEGFDFHDITASMNITKDYYIDDVKINFGMSMLEIGNITITCTIDYQDFNNASLPSFDRSEYIDSTNY